MFQWKAFQFFEKELVKEVGADSPHQLIQKLDITCSTSGRGNLVFGDAEGYLNLVDRDFKIYSFQAYKRTVTHVLQLKQSNIMVTVGDDEESISPVLKVWNLDKSDKAGNPLCLRVVKVLSNPRAAAIPVTFIAALEDLSQVAIGLCNGIVLLLLDLAHERVPKQVMLPPLTETPVTGLGFLQNREAVTLFVVTTDSVVSYRTTQRITKEELDDKGCELGCAVMGDEHDLSVGRKEAVYFYEQEGRGPCFAFEGEKKLLSWFRSYLIVVCQDPTQAGLNVLNIYDLKNKFIAFSSSFPSVSQIVSEWGSIFVLTRDGLLFQLEEKDTQTKLEMLFKRSLYSVAIELAHSQQYDYNSIIDIFTKYGDHLYGKGDYDGAIQQYLHTIGRLEASYVIRKFLDAQRIHNLTLYLQALHKAGLANADHTTLLLNCYTKLKDVQKLDEFIKTDSEWKFEVETAIKVCRQAGYHDHALFLAKKHSQHDWYLKILLEDLKNHESALEYISILSFSEAEKNLKKYGKALVTALPEQTTTLLMQLCTNYKPKAPKDHSIRADSQSRTKATAEEFIHIFVNQPEWLTKFLEFIITQGVATPPIYNTLLELYLREDGDVPREERLAKALSLLRDPRAQFDEDHALVLAQLHDFKAGVIHIYEKLKLYHEILQYYMENNDHDNVIAACKLYGDKEPNLWVQALSYFAGKEEDSQREITEVLLNIDQANLLPPLVVIQVLATKSTATLSVIKDYIMRRLSHENLLIAEDEHQIRSYSEETEKMRNELEELRTGARIFQLNKCTLCTSPLDLPAVHFLCMHSFHQRCLGENERECPVCAPNNRKIFAMKKALQDNSGLHEQFFKQLENSADGFQVVSDYFGRGIFDDGSAGMKK